MSLTKAIRELQDFRDDFLDGAFPQRSALGPGSLSSAILKSKSITSSMIDVSELAAVSANTGALTVTGAMSVASGITIGAGGYIAQGRVSYADAAHAGFWMGDDAGTPKFKLGNAALSSGLHWDGATLTINGGGTFSGALSAATGTFAGSLSAASGTFTGSLSAATGTLGNLTVNGTLTLGTGGISGAQLNVAPSGAVTATGANVSGAITATSGSLSSMNISGALTIGVGGKIQWESNTSYIDANGIVLSSAGTFGDSIVWRVGGVDVAGIYASASNTFYRYTSTGAYLQLGLTNWVLGNLTTHVSLMADSAGNGLYVAGRLFPGFGTGAGATQQYGYYIDAGSIQANGIGIGGMLGVSSGNTINLVAPGVGSGAPGNWSSNVPTGADYFIMQIGGVNRRIAYWANA